MKKVVISDFEGTLSDHAHRLEFAYAKQWEEFFGRLAEDGLRSEVWNQIKAYGVPVIIVTGVWEKFRPQMEAWLKKNEIEYMAIYMKRPGDSRPSEITKAEIYDSQLKDSYEVLAVFDDLPQVIDMWKSKGLHVIDVGNPTIESHPQVPSDR